MNLHVIYTRDNRILLSRKQYVSWQEIQEDIEDYMASLGPWLPEQTIEYLQEEHPGLSPDAAEQVCAFLSRSDTTITLRFKPSGTDD
ncbi:hypothetical protein KDX16_12405 [Burkholderia vietnamiensis]|uniref:hypothetical protein n=1 Tax=Burkholderia vietnamiensis TaxID=60552 RepID=UPI00075DA1BB|nr:hypothetical protein [Burkholderia vietnamiensis]KVE94567.1 hypothetical protein WJ01_16455 [Burkholderia vietnamiensis]MBR7916640.1 hypothetical protein [Burkholderia vietnamiensis]